MIADTLTITAVVAEIRALVGARIERIYQPTPSELLLYLYKAGEKKCLLLSTHPGRSRLHLTEQSYRHPEEPPSFCMLLRKYLAGGVILKIEQPPAERIVEFTVRSMDGIFTVALIAELMGRRSNLILVDRSEGEQQILGALKNIGWEQNPYRAIFPGESYRYPPVPDKLNPYDLNRERLVEELIRQVAGGKSPERALLGLILGVSPLVATELVHRSGWGQGGEGESAQRLVEELQRLFQNTREGRFKPCRARAENRYAPYQLTHLETGLGGYPTMNRLLDDYYQDYVAEENTANLRRSLHALTRKRLNRAERKLDEQEQDLKRAEDKERYLRYGETLLTYAGQVPPGAKRVELPDPYSPEESITISLNPGRSVSANAQHYFRLYRKAKKTGEKARQQVRLTRGEVGYWRQLMTTLRQADYKLLELIRQELRETARKPATSRRRAEALPLAFRSREGNTILVGRNRRQNDLVTFKLATREDTWLHARGMPGSHVVIKGTPYPPPPELLEEAAQLAAYYSKGRENTTVEVDYTAVKFVRRTPGGKPGQVLYTDFRTIAVRPKKPHEF